MSDVEKQEGQKTVVAFIAGLLIGGLLVWVFSASPDDGERDAQLDADGDTDSGFLVDDEDSDSDDDSVSDASPAPAPEPTPVEVGNGDIEATDQAAGNVVALSDVSYPTANGWVVVRDYEDGIIGKILGAARYSTDEGLLPESVNLLRATEAGKSYQIVFFSENGDRVFDLKEDILIPGFETTFTAN